MDLFVFGFGIFVVVGSAILLRDPQNEGFQDQIAKSMGIDLGSRPEEDQETYGKIAGWLMALAGVGFAVAGFLMP